MNSLSDNTDTVFSGDFHDDEKSEGVRQSDSGVQIVPASGSPSELSAHQMGASLAGTSRLKTEPVDSTSILDVQYLLVIYESSCPWRRQLVALQRGR